MQTISNPRQFRSRVSAAFRRMAQGVRRKPAYAANDTESHRLLIPRPFHDLM